MKEEKRTYEKHKVYENYSDDVNAKMKAIRNFVAKKFGKNENVYKVSLDMLADCLNVIEECNIEISRDGLLTVAANGFTQKHPLLTVLKDTQSQALKIMNEFGLNPKSLSKIKLEEDDTLDELNALING